MFPGTSTISSVNSYPFWISPFRHQHIHLKKSWFIQILNSLQLIVTWSGGEVFSESLGSNSPSYKTPTPKCVFIQCTPNFSDIYYEFSRVQLVTKFSIKIQHSTTNYVNIHLGPTCTCKVLKSSQKSVLMVITIKPSFKLKLISK